MHACVIASASPFISEPIEDELYIGGEEGNSLEKLISAEAGATATADDYRCGFVAVASAFNDKKERKKKHSTVFGSRL